MNNIQSNIRNVNNLLAKILPNATDNSNYSDFFNMWENNKLTPQDKCSHKVPFTMAYHPREKQGIPQKRVKLISQCLEEVDKIKKDEINDDIVREILKKIERKNCFFRYVMPKGEVRYFEGFTKGSKRYNTVYNAKIQDAIKEMYDRGYETFALTITCDPNLYYHNRIYAWQKSTEAINAVLENIRKNHEAQYVWVKESFKSGYPHAHIVIGFPKGTIKGYDKLKNRARMFYGWLYNEIRKRVKSKIFRLECVKGKNLKYYLTKYISKFDNFDIHKLSEKKESFTDTERKNLYCFIFTKLSNTRQFGISNGLKKKIKEAEDFEYSKWIKEDGFEENITFDEYTTRLVKQGKYSRLREILIMLCNNPLFTCGKNISYIKQSDFYAKNNCSIKDFEKKDETERVETDNLFKRIGCGGCIFSHFRDFLLNEEDILFSTAYFSGNNELERKPKEEILKNDKIYLIKVAKRWFFFMRHIIAYGESVQQCAKRQFKVNATQSIIASKEWKEPYEKKIDLEMPIDYSKVEIEQTAVKENGKYISGEEYEKRVDEFYKPILQGLQRMC